MIIMRYASGLSVAIVNYAVVGATLITLLTV
jgi:hypothetical protein